MFKGKEFEANVKQDKAWGTSLWPQHSGICEITKKVRNA
jgi:hypothetical protein